MEGIIVVAVILAERINGMDDGGGMGLLPISGLRERLVGYAVRAVTRRNILLRFFDNSSQQLHAICVEFANGEYELLLLSNDLCRLFCDWRRGANALQTFRKSVYAKVNRSHRVSVEELLGLLRHHFVPDDDFLGNVYFDEYAFFFVSMQTSLPYSQHLVAFLYTSLAKTFGRPLGIQFMRTKRSVDVTAFHRLIDDLERTIARLRHDNFLKEIRCRYYQNLLAIGSMPAASATPRRYVVASLRQAAAAAADAVAAETDLSSTQQHLYCYHHLHHHHPHDHHGRMSARRHHSLSSSPYQRPPSFAVVASSCRRRLPAAEPVAVSAVGSAAVGSVAAGPAVLSSSDRVVDTRR